MTTTATRTSADPTSRPRTATAAVVRTEARLFLREPGALFWIVLFPVLLLGILGLIPSFREPDDDLGGQRLVDLYLSVSVLIAMLMAAITSMPTVLTGYRERGILRRLRTTPVHPGTLLGAQVALFAAATITSIVLVLGVGTVVFDSALPRSAGWYAVSLLLALLAAFALGALLTAVSPTTKVGQTLSTIMLFPMLFTAGVWLPVQTMSGWLHTIVAATPFGAAAEALVDSQAGRTPDLVDLAVTGGWTIVLGLIAIRQFRWE